MDKILPTKISTAMEQHNKATLYHNKYVYFIENHCKVGSEIQFKNARNKRAIILH